MVEKIKGEDDLITASSVRELLDYDAGTGQMHWRYRPTGSRQWNTRYAGRIAGSNHNAGYIKVKLGSRFYLAHRLIWLHQYGEWPRHEVDHINGTRSDNRRSNLRDVSISMNRQNIRAAHSSKKSSNLLGVATIKGTSKFKAQIHANGKLIYLGAFDTDDQAHTAYLLAKRQLHEGCTI